MTRRRDITKLLPHPTPERERPGFDTHTLLQLSPPLTLAAQPAWWHWVASKAVMPELVATVAQQELATQLRSDRIAALRSWWEREVTDWERLLRADVHEHAEQRARQQLYARQRKAALALADWRTRGYGSWWVSRRRKGLAELLAEIRDGA